jgi:hypothetical protein
LCLRLALPSSFSHLNELHSIAQRLTELGKKRPSAAARRDVMEALNAKAQGIRINAAKVLAAWGDKESLEVLLVLLDETATNPPNDLGAKLKTLVDLLIPHVVKLDRDRVIELYFSTTGSTSKHYLRPLLYAFPFKSTASAIAARYREGKNVDEIPAMLENMQFYGIFHKRKD